MSYFNPGEVYTFRCLNLENTATKVISIVFDINANATVSFATDAILPTDKRELVFFAPEQEYEIINEGTSTVVNIIGQLDKFWYLFFDEQENPIQCATTIAGGGTATITCPCGQGTGDCTVSTTGSGDCKKIQCDATANCTTCNPPKVTVGSNTTEKTFVLIKANDAQV
ncbi:MAG: hypothetical protein K9G64_00550 [Bacteroidia bacterium]|nr:hypothetical protein [Bacteroidia bacterium]